MADYTKSKKRITGNFPQKVSKDGGAGVFDRVEPFLTPERLKAEFLFGIPLKSILTNETMSDDTLKILISKAASEVEAECRVDIFQVQRKVRLEWDRTKHLQGWGQLNLGFSNISSIEELSIRTVESTSTENPNPSATDADGRLIYQYPLAWIDIDSDGHKGIIHTVPLQTAYSGTGIVGSYNGAASALLTVLNQISWMPSFWFAKITTGFADNSVPSPINSLIGNKVALKVLSMLGPLIRNTSKSIGIDGVSQGLSGPGYQIYTLRIADLEKEIASLKDLIGKYFGGRGIFMTHI
jgi:hypothetical protein